MLELLNTDVRIINCDETWVNDLDFRKMRWVVRGESSGVTSKEVAPRISVIMAIDNYGNTYVCTTQVNTDENVFCLYLENLAAKLSKEDPGWKQNSILLLDGAKYHMSAQTRDIIRRIGCKTCFTAPYSFQTSPIELAFAAVKKTFINPGHIKTGKK